MVAVPVSGLPEYYDTYYKCGHETTNLTDLGRRSSEALKSPKNFLAESEVTESDRLYQECPPAYTRNINVPLPNRGIIPVDLFLN
jgi:hypothetical protein